MERQPETIDLSDLRKQQILERVRQILQESYIEKFTLILKRQVQRSRTQKKLQQKQNAIKKIKYRYSGSTNPNNLSVLKDNNIIDKRQHRASKDSTPCISFLRGPCKKNSRISQMRSRDASRLNESFYTTARTDKMPKSLQLYYQGEYQLALIQFFDEQRQLKIKLRSIKQTKQEQDCLSEYAKLMINIGNCYFCQKDYQKAIKYYKMEIESNKVDQKLIGQKYNNLGSCYAQKKQNQMALKCFNEALKIYAKYPELDCSNLLKNIGIIYFRSCMYSSAEGYFQQSINQRKAKSPENQEALLNTYYKLGLCQKYSNKFQQAINNLLFALNISEKGYSLHDQILKQVAEIYEMEQKFSESLLYYEKLSDQYERKELCQGEIYQKVARIHLKQKNVSDHDRFMKLAQTQYRKFNSAGKVS